MSAATSPAATVNAQNPWPGLLAFRESDQEFYHGRAGEIEELFRLVMRERVVVLFGLSGLGKSSLLQAGLFPLLRPQRILPVYVRLDFSAGAPDLVTQVTTRVTSAAVADRTEAPQPRDAETLWEYFHREGNNLWNERNRPVMPLLVLDQFEEIFTLGRLNAERDGATDRFVEQLADIAEGRPPVALKTQIDRHPEETDAFRFARHHYKVLLSIREDFLPDLESLRARMPALALNRFRLRRMNGEAALQVVGEAKDLIDLDVARQVVRFVSADRERPLADVEVEPALLSVVCRELNNKRQNLRQERITVGLLEGSQQEVLADFYERSLADIPPEVRLFIEDRLLTVSGYRDSVALENALSLPGVSLASITELVERRLLRREERGGVQRLELTHDLLVGVVRASRDARKLGEQAELERLGLLRQQEAMQQALLAAQEAERRERDKRELKRYRVAVVIVVALLLLAVGAAVWAGMAQREAQKARAQAEDARRVAQAERLRAEEALTDTKQQLQATAAAQRAAQVALEAARATVSAQPVDARTQELLNTSVTALETSKRIAGVTSAKQSTMLALLGNPRDAYDNSCRPVTNPQLLALITVEDVGPFKVNGLRPAVEALRRIFAEIAKEAPDLYARVGTAGMLCARLVRGSETTITNHAWGTAIDLTLDGKLGQRGDSNPQGYEVLAPYFERAGFFWGVNFSTAEAFHFEAGDELVRQWFPSGLLKR